MIAPMVSLGDLLSLERRPVKVLPDAQYTEIGVYSFGRGIFHKQPRSGLQVGDKDLYLIKNGDFILQITFAWEGAVALASAAEDGLFGSVRFPAFRVDESRCFPSYLVTYFRTPSGREQLSRISPGSAGRNRVLSLKRIPEVMVPLPPLDAQRRIVARIEELAAKIEEARGLRREAVAQTLLVAASVMLRLFSGPELAESRRMADVLDFRYELVHPGDGTTGPLRFVGLQHIEASTGKRKGEDHILAQELDGRKFRFSPGEIVYGYLRPYLNKVWIADCEGICSVDQYVLRPRLPLVDTSYLAYFMRSPLFVEQANSLTNNLLLPRLRSGLLASIRVPVPSLGRQREIVGQLDTFVAALESVKQLQAETAAELDALLPSVLDRAFKGELV